MPKRLLKKPTTTFRERVFKVVGGIPKGKVLSYQQVAQLAGSSRACRAVGNILNKNPHKDVPCHRVVRSNGEVGGYAHGVKAKITILQKEGVKIGKFFFHEKNKCSAEDCFTFA